MDVKSVKLSAKKSGKGYVSSYTVNISLNEALELGFVNEDRTVNNIEKVIDTENNQIIIRKATKN